MPNKLWALALVVATLGGAAPDALASHHRTGAVIFSHDPDGETQIFKVVLPEGEVHQLTGTSPVENAVPLEGNNAGARFSPDGTRIVFTSDRDGDWDLYTMDPDGHDVEHLVDRPGDQTSPVWSLSGTRIAFIEDENEIHVAKRNGFYVKQLPIGSVHTVTSLDWAPCRAVLYSAQKGPRDFPRSYTIGPMAGPLKSIGVGSWDMRWNRQKCDRVIFSNSKGPPESTSLYTMNRKGERRGLVRTRHAKSYDYTHDNPAWSHDGQRLAYGYMDHNCFYCNELRIYDVTTGEDHTVLTASEVWFWDLDWQP